MTTPTRVAAGLLSALVAVGGLTACSGGGDGGGSKKAESWSDTGANAKELLDGTSGIEVSLSTGDDPGTDYLSSASGTIVADPPAFEGTVAGRVSGFEASSIDVVSVDGTLWIKAPILGWTDQYQPADLCAPDPATLLDPTTGVSTVLTSSTDVKAGESERGGTDNKEVFHTYTGTATGDSIRAILPCAEGDDFEATYRLDDEGYLRTARLTGVFFKDSEPLTYTIDVTKYDVTKDVSAPK
ncbi:LppX_LprAFG lipoprotein [Nocardioides carbamazepini]|uniref:LppX_LprAFG lipoprotein n=1 Tax=Nocardioides carbamazepini TaxID=2854259 RepID=UPI00214A17B3|nr:LppX_LprAFG lipoprotein [Nocardioides carbamazepini]MCR1783302.1 LppX_LprAFG lipoprotein [Nocardioides carbamazepini]